MDDNMTSIQQTNTYAEPIFEETSSDLQLLSAFNAALTANDDDEIQRLRKLIPVEPEPLMAMKECFGAEFVRKKGYRIDLADKRYGDGWLDSKQNR